MTKDLRPFHLAVPVANLDDCRHFYGDLLGCEEGRSDSRWIDFNFFGHQFVCHLQPDDSVPQIENSVDGQRVSVPHFGVVLSMREWRLLADRLEAAGVKFVIAPQIRFAGQAGEQGTLFLSDPSGNMLEFKGFADLDQLFATD